MADVCKFDFGGLSILIKKTGHGIDFYGDDTDLSFAPLASFDLRTLGFERCADADLLNCVSETQLAEKICDILTMILSEAS